MYLEKNEYLNSCLSPVTNDIKDSMRLEYFFLNSYYLWFALNYTEAKTC